MSLKKIIRRSSKVLSNRNIIYATSRILSCLVTTFGEGNGTPLQYSCLENPMDGGAWQAANHGVTKSQTHSATSLSLFTFMHWRRKWQPTPVFLPGESQGWGILVGCHLWVCTESDMTEVTQHSIVTTLKHKKNQVTLISYNIFNLIYQKYFSK